MKTLCIYGCGGMGREVADLAYNLCRWEKLMFVDDKVKNETVDGIQVYTLDNVLLEFSKEDLEFIVATGEPYLRRILYNKLEEHKLVCTSIIDKKFILPRTSTIGNGTIVHMGATITCNVHIGKGCILNVHTVIGHDVTIGDYTVISPNSTIGGDVHVGANCYLGSGSIIRNGISIGENSIIGMGAVVLKDVNPNSVMVGNPAKLLRENFDSKVFR
jgi:sugar O-acyltransferase (sialic acid O-acetyltransferase NeuD family)